MVSDQAAVGVSFGVDSAVTGAGSNRRKWCHFIPPLTSRTISFNSPCGELAVPKEMDRVFADVVRPELIRRAPKVFCEILDCVDVRPHGILRVVTTLEFIQHQLSKMGHRDLLPRNFTEEVGSGLSRC